MSDNFFYTAAFVLFVVAAINGPYRFSLIAAGLACLAATLVF